ncbi:MAG: G1 family glutamic endopeptidase, partial [Acidimicrobiales bacterium]
MDIKSRLAGLATAAAAAAVVLALCVPASLASATSIATRAGRAPSSAQQFIPAHKGEVLTAHGGSVTSLNWAGYVDTGSGISSVTGTFSAPMVSTPGIAAAWTGIGGFSTSDLIQAGVTGQLPAGFTGPGQDYAWYELLPGPSTPVGGPVSPGDTISVSIRS